MSERKENTPRIRFPEFTEAWEQRRFSDFTKLSQGLQIAIDKRYTDPGINREFYITNEFLNPKSNKKYYIENPSKTVVATKDDILMTRTGNTGKVVTDTKGAFHNNFFKIAYDKTEINKQFLYFLLISSKIQKEILVRAGTSTIPDLNHNDFYKIKVSIPNVEEQQKIGSFFKQFDDTIALHQRKLNNVKNLKAGLLQKMFPKNGEDFPEVRFPGFTDAWEQRRFDLVFDPIPNNSFSRADLSYDEGKIKSIHYGDILIKYGSVTDCGRDVIPFITGAEVSDHESQLLQDGDVLIADAAEDKTVGKATEIVGITGIPVVSGLHTIACRPKVKMQPNYLGYYMNSPSYHQQLLPLMQGIKVLSLSRTNLAKSIICYPTSAQEQSLIGKVFANVDHLITLHQRKLEHLQEQKKALLQQMFI
ncbi:type I restriction enzyme S subunit [Paenibacillus sp. RC73]|uniref:restriction endonuclease subunit S n=1 Tax=Paenibacillus sp. RC73 TaxID=3156250 RepID=UPI003839A826